MDSISENLIEIRKVSHQISCDGCGKTLGVYEEDAEGYFYNRWQYYREVYIDTIGWHSLKIDLCPECLSEKDKEISKALSAIGFKNKGK